MDLALLSDLNRERAARRAVAVLTTIADGGARLVREADAGSDPHAATLAERGAGPGIAGLDHDGPSRDVFDRPFRGGSGKVGAAVCVQHESAVPRGGLGDEIERAFGVGAGVAGGAGRQAGRGGAG